MDYLQKNLQDVEDWIITTPNPDTLEKNSEFMELVFQLMKRALYLLRVAVSLVPSQKVAEKGYGKKKAIILGHMVRIMKLYEGFYIHITGGKAELASIFARLIFETAIRMRYLMNADRDAFRSYILTSYRAEREILIDLKEKASYRPLTKIEKRILRKIKTRLRRDHITLTELLKTKNWNLDGKNFRGILTTVLEEEKAYSYLYGSMSHSIHGDWYDVSVHQLKREGRYYQPKWKFAIPDPRLACPMTRFSLETIMTYLEWSKGDPNGVITPIVSKLLEFNASIDAAHEHTLS